MLLLARPLLRRVAVRSATDPLPRGTAAGVFVALLLAALTAEVIGIHAIFGAFLLGAVIPHESVVARTLTRQLEHLVTILLLPAFFAFTGMRTRIDLVSGLEQWMICGLIILVATLGKFGGTLAAARLSGLGWRAAAALGTLMNTRGLMELIVLNIGLDLRVISPPLFAMMVVMALVTTMATAPVLQWLLPQTASAPATESARVTHGGQASSAPRAERRQAEGPSAGHQK
jgi:Kef-type K+ transport system membrane component KefB